MVRGKEEASSYNWVRKAEDTKQTFNPAHIHYTWSDIRRMYGNLYIEKPSLSNLANSVT